MLSLLHEVRPQPIAPSRWQVFRRLVVKPLQDVADRVELRELAGQVTARSLNVTATAANKVPNPI